MRVFVTVRERTAGSIFWRWVIGGGIVGGALTLLAVTVVVALFAVVAVSVGALAGSVIGAVAGALRVLLAVARRE